MDRLQQARCALRPHHRQWPASVGAGLIAAISCSLPAAAQEVSEVHRELKQMRQQYEAELSRMRRDYDARLSRLEARLKAAERKPAVAPVPPPETLVGPVATAVPPPPGIE